MKKNVKKLKLNKLTVAHLTKIETNQKVGGASNGCSNNGCTIGGPGCKKAF